LAGYWCPASPGYGHPDGNTWLLQEVTTRLPGRVSTTSATYDSVEDLAEAMRRAETAHGEYERQLGHRDEDWPSWYAQYMAQHQTQHQAVFQMSDRDSRAGCGP
jgi:hypothetical protein